MKALFYNVKGAGHVNPTLPLARGLVQAGHEVVYTITPEWRVRVEALGCSYRNTGETDDAPFTTADYNPEKGFHSQLVPAAAALLPRLVEEARRIRPDVVIYDSCAPWGLVVAAVLGCPAVCSVSTVVFDAEEVGREFRDRLLGRDDLNREALVEIQARWGVDLGELDRGFFYAGENLVYSCEDLNPTRSSVPGRFHLVGPLFGASATDATQELAAHELERFVRGGARRRVYVSMGTVAGHEASFFAPFLEALGGRDDYEVLLSVGSKVLPEAFGALPANVTVRQSVPQIAVLEHADVFVTHAGANSMHEALFHGVPLVCIPHFGDQPTNASRVAAEGAGVALPLADLSAARIASDVARVLDDASYAANAARIGKRLRAAGGLDRALRIVEELAALRLTA